MACGAGLLLGLSQGKLLSQTWDGSSNNRWDNSANWTPASVPNVVDATATLGSIVASNTSIGLRGTRKVGTLNIQGSQNFTIFNGTGGTRDLEMDVSSGTAAINISGSNTSQLASTVRLVLFDNTVISNTGTGSFTINGVVSESGGAKSLTHNGTGLTVLNGANTFSGGLTINAGTVDFGNNAAAGTGTLSLNGGKIEASGASRTLTNAVTVGGNFEVGGALNLTLSGAMNLGASTRTITTSNTALTTFSGIVSGTGGITKAGSGTLILSGANTYSGATTINAGVLNIQNATALGTTAGATTVASGAQLQIQGGISSAENITISGTGVSSTGAIRNISGNNTLSGTITRAADSSIQSDSGLLTLSGGIGGNFALTVSGSGNTTATGVVSGTGALTKTGSGTLVLSGANTYTGATTVNGGTLRAGSAGTAFGNNSSVTLANTSGVTLDLAGFNTSIGSLAGGGASGGNVTLGSGTLTTGGNNLSTSYAGVVSGTGGLVKNGSGTQTLSGANTYSGATTINAGVLNVQNATALGTTAGSTTVNSGGALALGGGITITGEALSIAGNGGGAGALRNASGNNTFSGDITLAADAEIENAVAGTLLTIGNTSYTNWINTTGSGYTVSFDGAGDIWLNSGITGSGTLSSTGPGNVVKNGSGTLTFYADQNWYTGSTTVNDGTLSLDTLTGLNGAIKGTVVNIGDGTGAAGSAILRNGSSTSPVANEMINDSATLTFRSDGLYNLNTQTETIGALDFTGGEVRTGTGGSLRINASSAAASITTHASSATALIDATGGDVQLNGSRTFTVANGTAATDLEVRGTMADGSAASGVTKSGSGRMALTGTTANTYTGTTTVNGGTLELAKSSGVTAISGSAVTVNSGGTLLLGNSNQINDSAALTLAGGTFSTGDTVGFSETLGTLTLSGTSSIDLGTASHLLQFADSSALSGSWTGSLTIYGWTGLPYTSGTSGQIFFGSSNSTLTSSQLAMISFSGFGMGAVLLTNGELVPVAVPETESVVAACLLALGVGWRERRRLGMLFCRLRNC